VHKIAILPTLLTLGNGICGFASIAYASRIRWQGATTELDNWYFLLGGTFIFAAMLFDALDGSVARLFKTSSAFGGQLDSLCDAISFGAAPAFLLLRLGQDWPEGVPIRQLIAVIAALYMVCTILRLARFNLENSTDPASHKRFKGLPSPAAAGCLAGLAILRGDLPTSLTGLNAEMLLTIVKLLAPLGGLAAALLMVSGFSYPHFTNQLLRRRWHFAVIVEAVLVISVVVLTWNLALFVLFWAYALHAPVRYLIRRSLRPKESVPRERTHLR
jgi:CDP-diacylglycerol--serine O-phosphatidyltransferase